VPKEAYLKQKRFSISTNKQQEVDRKLDGFAIIKRKPLKASFTINKYAF
jgi:hypothetical protein